MIRLFSTEELSTGESPWSLLCKFSSVESVGDGSTISTEELSVEEGRPESLLVVNSVRVSLGSDVILALSGINRNKKACTVSYIELDITK